MEDSVDDFGIRPTNQSWANDSDDEDDFDHQYDDYEDLFSNETDSILSHDQDDKEIGMYLETDPALQREVAQLIMLKRHLDSLQQKLHEKEFGVLKAREELDACRVRMKALQEELAIVERNISLAKENNNMASYHRLVSKCEKLKTEIEADQKLEVDIQAHLQEAELAHSRVEIEQRHYSHLAEKVIEKEEKVTQHKDKMARYRLNKEQHIAKTAARRQERAQKELQRKIDAKNQRQQHIIESAILNHEKAKVFLKESLTKVQQQEAELGESHKLYKQRRMETIVGLKNSIALNRENLKALQARDAAFDKKDKIAEKLERQQVLKEGGNPEQVLLRRKKLKQFEKEKQDFEAKQKVNKARIVASILNEERNISRRKKQQPHLWPDKHREKAKELGPPPKPSIHTKIELNEKDEPIFLQQIKYMKQTPREDIQREVLSEASSSELVTTNPKSSSDHRIIPHPPEEQEESLALPEFQGLWEQRHKMYKVPKEDVPVKPVGGTKMEQEILHKTLTKHREGIIVKQVAAGRVFKGQPFYSKPDVIHFKDLDVGRTYKKKIVITNVSYSINFLKLTGLSEHLKDFIKIDFNPPGQMSAGMSCDMTVTFKPMINEDLIGEVSFMAQTGPFTIPLKCTTKKCDLSVDVTSIDFGSQVVGETIRRTVTLVNKGALGTRFDFQKVPDKAATTYTLETSLGRLTTAETPGITNDDSEGVKGTPHPETGARSKRPPVSEGMPQTADRSFKIAEYPEVGEDEYEEGADFAQAHYGRAEGDEITFATPATEYQAMAEELKVGEVMSGEIEPFSSVRLDIVFAPCIPGDIQATFRISFSDPESQPLEIKASAVAIHVPVWLERQNIDLKICMYDRLYQDQIIVHNRASTALRLNFEVPRELRSHLELLPKTGYIQAKSTFTAQLKFLPRQNLAEDASGLFDPETGILESPLVIRVADQTRPVEFVVNAVVTSSDLEFDRVDIDFGHCGIYESVVSTVKLTNHSILPQLFGFVNIPEYVDVQPNDGFGTILPLETIEIDIIVEAKRARAYDFTLTCRSGINRDFPVHCRAVGVHPPLDLSHQVIHFAATALDDVSTALIHVINAHTSANEFTHPVPRIGKGDIVPVGPTSFEFVLPEDAPISVTPCVGTVKPGEKCHVTLEFAPKLSDADVRKEAVHVMQEQREEKAREEQERIRKEQEELVARQQEEEKAAKGKKTPKTPAKPKTGDSTKSAKSSAKSSEKLDQPLPTPEMIDENSTAYKAARASLTRSYPGNFRSFTIPCFVATGSCSDSLEPSSLSYNNANTLYLEVHCPTIKPPVVIISNHGHNLTDFGQVSIGQNTIKPISIQNISDHPIELTLSVLDTNGPFQVLNALRMLKPDETHTLLVSFTPNAGKVFYEVLKIVSTSSTLDVCLTGKGVTPVIHLSPEDGAIDMGHVLQGETSQTTFTLENRSSLAVRYSIKMDSASLLKHENQQQLPEFVRRDGKPAKALVGPQNYSGSCVFDCVPCEGEIKTGETHEIEVTFNPDHESRHFSDGARVVLFNTEEAHVIHVTGKGHDHMMYIEGNDPLDVAVESLACDRQPPEETTEALPPAKNILLSFTSHVSDEGFTEACRTLVIGCLKSNAFAGRKNGEWIVDNVQPAQSKGFVAEPLKGTVDVDGTKDLVFTWNPPENHDPSTPIETSVLLTLKGDVTLTYNVILTGLVSFK